MKFLYCILFFYVAANAEPVPPTREQLESLAKLILNDIKHAPEEIDAFLDEAKKSVKQMLIDNQIVVEVQAALNKKLAKVEPGSEDLLECFISIEEGFNKLVPIITNDLLPKLVNKKYGKHGDYFNTLKKELSDLTNVLENSADKEIETCLDGKSNCKLTGEFLVKGEEYLMFKNVIKSRLPAEIKLSVEYFHSVGTSNNIIAAFSGPAYKCLNAKKH